MNEVINNFPDISFIDNETVDNVINQMINDFQEKYLELTGKKIALSKTDPYRIMMYAAGLQIYQTMQYVDRAGKQGLLKYSYGEFLDNIGALRGIQRMQATAAVTTIRFEISKEIAAAVSIPAGTRVTNGNEVYFATNEYTEILPGATFIDVAATCTENGVSGNGFLPGEIHSLVDVLPYISTVKNTTETGGGNDREMDDALKDRIFIGPSAFSTAGTETSYEYWTKAVSPEIQDVKVSNPSDCVVDVRFVMRGGEIPGEAMITQVSDTLKRNPRTFTDQVIVKAPETIAYNVNVTYYIDPANKSAVNNIQNLVKGAVENYTEWQSEKIGRDIDPSYLTAKMVAAGAKRPVITSPVYTKVQDTSVAVLGTLTVTYGGME